MVGNQFKIYFLKNIFISQIFFALVSCSKNTRTNTEVLDPADYVLNLTTVDIESTPLFLHDMMEICKFYSPDGENKNFVSSGPIRALAAESNRLVDLIKNNDKPSNLILVGHPGLDTEYRILSLASIMAMSTKEEQRCVELPESWRYRQIYKIDLNKLKNDAGRLHLSGKQYIDFLSRTRDMFGSSIFFIDDIHELEYQSGSAGEQMLTDVLAVFINNRADSVISITPDGYGKYFQKSSQLAGFRSWWVDPVQATELKEFLVRASKHLKTGDNHDPLPQGVIDTIVRLVKGFLPDKGPLDESYKVFLELVNRTDRSSMTEQSMRDLVVNIIAAKAKLSPKTLEDSKFYSMEIEDIDKFAKGYKGPDVEEIVKNQVSDIVLRSENKIMREIAQEAQNLAEQISILMAETTRQNKEIVENFDMKIEQMSSRVEKSLVRIGDQLKLLDSDLEDFRNLSEKEFTNVKDSLNSISSYIENLTGALEGKFTKETEKLKVIIEELEENTIK